MKQFILAKTIVSAIPSGGSVTTDGQLIITDTTGADFLQFTVGRGNTVVPDNFVLYKKNLRFDVTKYAAAVNFKAEFTPTLTGSYKYNEVFVVISKRGTVFNERNVWTTSGHGANVAAITDNLIKNINVATGTHGLTATKGASNKIILANLTEPTADYDVVVKFEGVGTTANQYAKESVDIVVSTTHGKKAIGDAAFVKDLAHKCIGDKGIEYTYVDAYLDTTDFYNNAKPADSGQFDIVNIHFYNPRYDHNIDEPLYQTIHVVVPKGDTTLTTALEGKDANNKSETSEGPAAGA